MSESTGLSPAAASYEIRPLSMAEILDAGFQLMKNHFALLGSLSLVGQVPTILVFSLFSWMLDPFALQKGEFPEIGATLLIGAGLWFLAMLIVLPIAIGAITAAVSDLYLGSELSIRECLERGVARMVPLMVTYVIFSVILAVAAGIVTFVVIATGAGVGAVLQGSAVGIGLVILLVAVLVPVLFALAGLLTLLPGVLAAVVVLEGISLFEAIARTWTLVASAPVRLSGIGLVLYLLVGIVPTGVQFMVGSVPVVGALVWGGVQALCQAYLYTTTVVAYFDIRCRIESFDLEHLAQLVEGTDPSPAPIR
jgi:hypothetical protein